MDALTAQRLEASTDKAHKRIDELERNVLKSDSRAELRLERLEEDVEPIRKVPEQLATINANITRAFEMYVSIKDDVKELRGDMDDVASQSKGNVQEVERRGERTIDRFILPLLMLLIGGAVGFFFQRLP